MTASPHTKTSWGISAMFFMVINLGILFLVPIPHHALGAVAQVHKTLEQAKAQLEAGQTTRALETVEELIDSLPPPDVLQHAYFLQATILQHDGQIADALNVMRQLLEEFPFSPITNSARILTAELYSRNQEYSQALTQLYQALDYATDQELRRTLFQHIRQAELDNRNPLGAVKAALNEMMLVAPFERLELVGNRFEFFAFHVRQQATDIGLAC